MKEKEMETKQTSEWTEAINFQVERAVEETIKSFIPTLDDYLEKLDTGDWECLCTGHVQVRFHPNHRVTATIPMEIAPGYTWAFREPFIEVEIDGTFEAHLQ